MLLGSILRSFRVVFTTSLRCSHYPAGRCFQKSTPRNRNCERMRKIRTGQRGCQAGRGDSQLFLFSLPPPTFSALFAHPRRAPFLARLLLRLFVLSAWKRERNSWYASSSQHPPLHLFNPRSIACWLKHLERNKKNAFVLEKEIKHRA